MPDTDGETFECRFCGETLVSGDREGNNVHFVSNHVADWHRQLEGQGLSELEAHLKVNKLVESLRTPAR